MSIKKGEYEVGGKMEGDGAELKGMYVIKTHECVDITYFQKE